MIAKPLCRLQIVAQSLFGIIIRIGRTASAVEDFQKLLITSTTRFRIKQTKIIWIVAGASAQQFWRLFRASCCFGYYFFCVIKLWHQRPSEIEPYDHLVLIKEAMHLITWIHPSLVDNKF